MSSTVLFDVPGPVGRRNIRIGTGVGLLVIAALLGLALVRLGGNGQLEAERWAILFDPTTGVPQSLGRALLSTLKAAAIGIALATVLGALLAVGRLSDRVLVRIPVSLVVEFFRAIPLLLVIFFAFLGFPAFGITVSALGAVVFGLITYNMAVLCEIFRAGILSIDRGQSEAAYSLGLRKWQVMTFILIPQGVRRMLPVLVSQLVVLLKDTSLGFIVGYVELLTQSRRNVGAFSALFGNRYSFQLYVAAAVIYIVVNLAISTFATWLEQRSRGGTRSTAATADAAVEQERNAVLYGQPL